MKFLLAACALLTAAVAAPAQPQRPRSLDGVEFEQKLNAAVPLDLEFRDEAGAAVRLGDYFHGRPVILVLAYYRCPMLCTEVLNGLVLSLLDVPFSAGRDFEVVIVSFDPREQPDLAAAKKKTYLERYARPGAEAGWHFLTGREESIRPLAQAVGFRYRYDAMKDQFAHASGITVLTPAGRVSRYFYDIKFPPRDLRLGLVEASEGKIGSPVDKVLLFCFHYDPAEGRYGPIIMNFVRAGGVLTVLAIGGMVVMLRRKERRGTARNVASGAEQTA